MRKFVDRSDVMTKTITPVSFFFGANNKSKYVSLFSEMYDPKDDGKHYILKGGPGTGKTTTLNAKKIPPFLGIFSLNSHKIYSIN